MIENKKRLYIFGTAALSVLVILVIYFSLIASGALNLLQNNIVISSESASKTYDGLVLFNHNYEVHSGKIKEHESMEVVFTEDITDIGTVENKFYVVITDENNNVVTTKYNITYVYGTLEVKTLPLKISTDSAKKIYDGTPLVNDNWDLLTGTLLDDHKMTIRVIGTITSVGKIDNDFIIYIVDKNNVDVTHMYDVVKELGQLEITGKVLTITTGTAMKEYDGLPLTSNDHNYDQSDLLEGHTITITSTTSIDTPSSVDNYASYAIRDENGLNVTDFYEVKFIYGLLTIKQKEISIETASDEKVYDGTPLTNDTVVYDDLLENHTIDIVVTGSLTYVSNTGKNTFSYKIYDEFGKDVTVYYKVNAKIGTLKVTSYTIILNSNGVVYDYDGTEKFNTEFTLSELTPLIGNHEIVIDKAYGETMPGTYHNETSFAVVDEFGENVTNNYYIRNQLGDLVINKISIAISSGSDSRVYNTFPLTNSEIILAGEVLKEHKLTITNDTSITDVGTKANAFEYAIYTEDNLDVAGIIYNVSIEFGTLEVTPAHLVAVSVNLNYMYNTETIYLSELNENEIYPLSLPYGYTYLVDFQGSITNVGEIANYFNLVILDQEGNISINYDIEYKYGVVSMLPQEVIIMTGSNAFEYTGDSYRERSYEIITGELFDNDDLSIAVDYLEVTEIGSYFNTVGLRVYEPNNQSGISNYNLTIIPGNLTVYDRMTIPITVSPKDVTTGYTGYEIEHSKFHISGENLNGTSFLPMLGYRYEATVGYKYETGINAGKYEIEIKEFSIIEISSGEDVTYMFEITSNTGTITIIDNQVTISSNDSIFIYSGELFSQSKEDITVSISNDYTYDLQIYGGRSTVGKSRMSFTLTIYHNGVDVTSSFLINNQLGYVIVEKAEINITFSPYEATVGETLNKIVLVYTYDLTKYTVEVLVLNDGVLEAGQVIELQLKIVVFDGLEDVTSNFKLIYDSVMIAGT